MTKPFLSDARVEELLAMPKSLSSRDWGLLQRPRRQRAGGNVRTDVSLMCETGERFRVIGQRNQQHGQRFSLQLVYVDQNGNEYHLLRVAGRASGHRNKIENELLLQPFRVNRLTERYQASQWPDDDFATPASGLVFDYHSAIEELGRLANITFPAREPRLL